MQHYLSMARCTPCYEGGWGLGVGVEQGRVGEGRAWQGKEMLKSVQVFATGKAKALVAFGLYDYLSSIAHAQAGVLCPPASQTHSLPAQ